jgi:four helix bundle protein
MIEKEFEKGPAQSGRLHTSFLVRTEAFSDRCLAVAEQLDQDGRFRRNVEQLAAAGCSVGANAAEADQAMSRSDFVRTLSIVNKELAETRFWLRLCTRREWIREASLSPLLLELEELRLIVNSMITRTKKHAARQTSASQR